MTHHDDASTFGDVLAYFGDDGTRELFRRLLIRACWAMTLAREALRTLGVRSVPGVSLGVA